MRPSLRPAAPSKVLRLLAEKYPTRAAVESRLIYLQGQLVLPKGVEHFMSDLHGEYAAFFHILNNCSGVIREKVDYVFGARLSGEEKAEFCTLVYYPKEKIEQARRLVDDDDVVILEQDLKRQSALRSHLPTTCPRNRQPIPESGGCRPSCS